MSSSPSAPAPVDPYTQAAAQYGLATGTANYNAGLNRTNSTNPLGSSTWSATPGTTSAPSPSGYAGGAPFGLGGGYGGYSGIPSASPVSGSVSNGAPTYTNTTQLTPWAQSELQQPLNTSGLPGMPGGPSITQNLQDTQQATFNQQMGYAAPEEALASEQLNSKLAAEGATPGSAAYNNEQDRLAREQTFTNQQAANAAITGGNQEQATLFGLGTQGLNNQITARAAPINEYNSLNGAAGSTATAQTPDISGAFGQQYQGQLAGYNAGVATNNATTSDVASLGMMAAMMYY